MENKPMDYLHDEHLSVGTREYLEVLNAGGRPVESLPVAEARKVLVDIQAGAEVDLDGIDENGNIKPDAQELVMNDLRGHFRPEFLNRLDEIIMFKPLTKDNIGGIVDLMVRERLV